jgi:hypothetical protein
VKTTSSNRKGWYDRVEATSGGDSDGDATAIVVGVAVARTEGERGSVEHEAMPPMNATATTKAPICLRRADSFTSRTYSGLARSAVRAAIRASE